MEIKTKADLLDSFVQIAIVKGYSDYSGDAERLINETVSMYENLPQDWHSDEEYSKLKKENELLKSKIENIVQNNTFQCDFVYDDENELYMSLYENMYKELKKLLKEK